MPETKLSTSQKMALEHITQYARRYKNEAEQTISHILTMSNVEHKTFEDATAKLKKHARVALQFHPDRPDRSMKTVAEALLEQGMYKSQFETLLSSGSVSAYPGGARDLWEKNMFGGAYQIADSPHNQRPKYGALNLFPHPDGPAPRFGSCYFLLYPAVTHRCTFTYLDSHQDPKAKGTYEEFHLILAALLEDAFVNEFAIGEKNVRPPKLIEHFLVDMENPRLDLANQEANRNLNHYIEAQVHGDISLQDDVQMLVADPAFKHTEVGKTLEQICLTYSIELCWHMGFALMVDKVPTDFRGPSMPSLAKRVARTDFLDTSMIGLAAMDLKRNPSAWSDRGTYEEVLQELKLLWHVLVRYGKPLRNVKSDGF